VIYVEESQDSFRQGNEAIFSFGRGGPIPSPNTKIHIEDSIRRKGKAFNGSVRGNGPNPFLFLAFLQKQPAKSPLDLVKTIHTQSYYWYGRELGLPHRSRNQPP